MTTPASDLIVFRADQRGRTQLGWLDSKHSFSFGGYRAADRMGFRALRVLNDDIVAPGGGFGEHPHRDMEIVTWVLDGGLAHGDSLGSDFVLRPGELQAMTAGRGITHSEFNASDTQPVHFLQIWLLPRKPGVSPRYEQRSFDPAGRRGAWQTLATGYDGATESPPGPVPIDTDAALRVTDLAPGTTIELTTEPGRHGYLHVATGSIKLGDTTLAAGDAAQWSATESNNLAITAIDATQALWFDLG